MASRIDRLEGKFTNLENRFDKLESRFESLELRVQRLENILTKLKKEVKQDIHKLDTKFTLVLEDLFEAKTGIHILQREAKHI